MENPNFEDLLLAGAIEVHGVDEKTGEFLYTFTNKMKDILPELYKEHIQQIHNEIMYFNKGVIQIHVCARIIF